MAQFKPCINRTACTEDGTHCRGCGRSHEEIAGIRLLTSEVSSFVVRMKYENTDEFLEYMTHKVMKKVSASREDN